MQEKEKILLINPPPSLGWVMSYNTCKSNLEKVIPAHLAAKPRAGRARFGMA